MDDLFSYKYIRKFRNTNLSDAKTSNSLNLPKAFLYSFISLRLIMWYHVFVPLTCCNNLSEDLKKASKEGLKLYLKRDSNTSVFPEVCKIFNNTFFTKQHWTILLVCPRKRKIICQVCTFNLNSEEFMSLV